MFQKNSHKLLITLGIIIIPILLLVGFRFTLADTVNNSDAIAVRIMPNPNHYSIYRWYTNQGIGGSPQALTIDGYEAVRNGRSVYIASANVNDVDGSNMLSENDLFYTNVYVISYNQEVKDSTLDILGQLLNNWKFNTNITQPGRCAQAVSTICSSASDCLTDDYCKSSKTVAIRDAKRLADLADMNTALNSYKDSHGGFCPNLQAGSYIPGKSISTWPSWQATLSAQLGVALPVDPINKLGKCSADSTENQKYNLTTCWNEVDREFSVPTGNAFNLPENSAAYLYSASSDGKSCSFLAPTEAGLVCDNNGTCIVKNSLFDRLNGYCGDGIVETDLKEQCDDKNTNNNDDCNNSCKWTIKKIPDVPFSINGVADALVYDDNVNATSINNKNGIYLKLDKMLDTPYAWFADTYNNLITQVRTYVKCYPYNSDEVHADDNWNLDPASHGKTGYICPKKTPDGWDYSFANHQHPGQIIKDFSIVGFPSRTAVNVETNEVWIAARSGAVWGMPGQVEKLQMDANGDYSSVAKIPYSKFSGLVRGLSIQRNGDIWVADCTSNPATASIKRFSAATLELNKTIGADGSFVCPYGLSIDSEDNIWMNDNGGGGMKKINPNTGVIHTYSGALDYGITVDNNDNAWGGGYTDYGIKKIPVGQDSGAAIHYTGFTDWDTLMTGITLDKDGNIWSGGYTPKYETFKFNQNGQLQPGFPVPSGGVNPHGIFGTSDGYVWQSHISSNIIRVFNPSGGVVADFKGGNVAGGIYTYSDATGLNRAMIMRSGLWVSDPLDSGFLNQHWGILSWQQDIKSAKQSLEVYARADNNVDNLKNKVWVRVYLPGDPGNVGSTWNNLDINDGARVGRYMQVKVLLRSMERGVTPVVWNLQVK